MSSIIYLSVCDTYLRHITHNLHSSVSVAHKVCTPLVQNRKRCHISRVNQVNAKKVNWKCITISPLDYSKMSFPLKSKEPNFYNRFRPWISSQDPHYCINSKHMITVLYKWVLTLSFCGGALMQNCKFVLQIVTVSLWAWKIIELPESTIWYQLS